MRLHETVEDTKIFGKHEVLIINIVKNLTFQQNIHSGVAETFLSKVAISSHKSLINQDNHEK